MAKTKPRKPKSTEPGTHIWRWPGTAYPMVPGPITHDEPKPPRGGLRAAEEADISQSPWPLKPHDIAKKEREKHETLADKVRRPGDHIPYALHDRTRVDESGHLEFTAAFTARMAGEGPRSAQLRRMFGILEALQQDERHVLRIAALVVESCVFIGITQEQTGADLHLSQPTVSRALKLGITTIQTRYKDLYHEELSLIRSDTA